MIPNTLPASLMDNPRIDQWVGFPETGRVAVRTGKVELGQGVLTAMAQIAAEELDVDLSRIDLTSRRLPARRPMKAIRREACPSRWVAARSGLSVRKCAPSCWRLRGSARLRSEPA